jgi:hypothetical protein
LAGSFQTVTLGIISNQYVMKRTRIIILLLVISLALFSSVNGQEKPGLKPKIGCDFVSSYIWRGLAAYTTVGEQNVLAPSIQPYFSLNYKGLELGTWGSIDFTGTYKELDYYLSYSLKGFTAALTDYYWASDWVVNNYFDYRKESTEHYVEAALSYQGEKIPVSVLVATLIYGADKQFEDPSKNNYSTYIEAGYTFTIQDYNLDLFLGVTPMDGLYGDSYGGKKGFAVVNAGVSGSTEIKITEKFSLPVKASVIANPQARKLFLVFAITL